jgi:hypothetical protein
VPVFNSVHLLLYCVGCAKTNFYIGLFEQISYPSDQWAVVCKGYPFTSLHCYFLLLFCLGLFLFLLFSLYYLCFQVSIPIGNSLFFAIEIIVSHSFCFEFSVNSNSKHNNKQKTSQFQPKIINLLNTPLTKEQTDILSLGQNYAIEKEPRNYINELIVDAEVAIRQLDPKMQNIYRLHTVRVTGILNSKCKSYSSTFQTGMLWHYWKRL